MSGRYNKCLLVHFGIFLPVICFSNLATATQLQHHVDGSPGSNVVGFQCFVVRTVWYIYEWLENIVPNIWESVCGTNLYTIINQWFRTPLEDPTWIHRNATGTTRMTQSNSMHMNTLYLQLLSRVNESNLIYLNTFLLLQSLLDSQYFVFRFKIETLLSSRQGLDKNLCMRRGGVTHRKKRSKSKRNDVHFGYVFGFRECKRAKRKVCELWFYHFGWQEGQDGSRNPANPHVTDCIQTHIHRYDPSSSRTRRQDVGVMFRLENFRVCFCCIVPSSIENKSPLVTVVHYEQLIYLHDEMA